MAELGQLKKRLRGVELSGQLAGAVKTAASAKLSIINRLYSSYRTYVGELEKIVNSLLAHDKGSPTEDEKVAFSHSSSPSGSSDPSEPTVSSPFEHENGDSDGQVKPCYVIIGHNKGLCGSFNTELHSYADEYISKHRDGKLYVCGKCAIAYFEGKTTVDGAFLLSDVPKAEQCKPLLEQLTNALMIERTSVTLIYQQFINTLTQTPTVQILNPPAKQNYNVKGRKNTEVNDILYIPDRMTVETDIQRKFYETMLYKIILESALSAQSATLTAMRTAYDNAVETAETLENEINKTRQRAVTTGVLETAFGMASEWEEEENGIRK